MGEENSGKFCSVHGSSLTCGDTLEHKSGIGDVYSVVDLSNVPLLLLASTIQWHGQEKWMQSMYSSDVQAFFYSAVSC